MPKAACKAWSRKIKPRPRAATGRFSLSFNASHRPSRLCVPRFELKAQRVLTKDSQDLFGISCIICRVLQVVQQAQQQIDHGLALEHHFGPAPEAGQVMPDVAVVLLNGEGQVLAGEQLILRDQPVMTFPVVRDKGLDAHADLVEQAAQGCIITPIQNPGHNTACVNVIGAPDPQLSRLFAIKCPIWSTSTVTTCAGTSDSGKAGASARTHFSTVTSLTPNRRPIMLKLMLPMPYSSIASAFIAGGLPRNGVSVK